MKEFKTYHPIVNFSYFFLVIGFSMFFMHPACLIISLFSGFIYSVVLKGRRAVRTNLIYMIPMILAAAALNPLFNHKGIVILGYLPSGNPLTLESFIYGIAAAIMIVSVICHFSCYNEVMTSDKFIYLFGTIAPSLSLIFSMTLRLIPKFSAQLKTVINAQKCIGRDVSKGNIFKRAKNGISVLSAMITWALENAVETADSMKARGYGTNKRTSFLIFRFDKRDMKAFLCIIFLGIYVFLGAVTGGMYFRYFPSVKSADFSWQGISVFAAYFLLCNVPLFIELSEVRKWKSLRSKI